MGSRCSFCAACTRKQGIFAGRPASFLVLEAESVFEAIRNRVGVLRSVRKGEELFVREPVKISVYRSAGL